MQFSDSWPKELAVTETAVPTNGDRYLQSSNRPITVVPVIMHSPYVCQGTLCHLCCCARRIHGGSKNKNSLHLSNSAHWVRVCKRNKAILNETKRCGSTLHQQKSLKSQLWSRTQESAEIGLLQVWATSTTHRDLAVTFRAFTHYLNAEYTKVIFLQSDH